MAAHCIYTDEMTGLMHGSPLWEPDCRPHEVTIGDVGYVRQGRFCRLFNTTLPPGDARNEFGTPDGFEQLILDERAMTHRRLSPGSYVSRYVTKAGADIQFTGSVLQAGAGFNFSCKRDRGAALIINSEGLRRDSEQLGAFKKYMLKHSSSWLSFANDPPNSRDISLHDLVFVTGRDNTADWAVAAFAERSTTGGISFQAGYTPVMGASFSIWGSWAGLRSLYSNCGPQLYPIAAANGSSSSLAMVPANTNDRPGLVCSAELQRYDQCIFLRGFKIMDRKSQVYGMMKLKVPGSSDGFGLIKAPLFESKANPTTSRGTKIAGNSRRDSNVDRRSFSMSPDSFGEDQPVLMYMGGSNEISPAEYLLMYILHNSEETNLAIIHDNDISAVVQACKNYTTFIEALFEVVPQVVVDSDGVGSISINGESSTVPSKTDTALSSNEIDLEQVQADIDTFQAQLTEVRRKISLFSNTGPAAARENLLRAEIEALNGAIVEMKTKEKDASTQLREVQSKSKTTPEQKSSKINRQAEGKIESKVDKGSQNLPERRQALKTELDIICKERAAAHSSRKQLFQERDELQKKLKELREARRMAVERAKFKEDEEDEKKMSEQALKAELARKERQAKEQQQRLEARARLLERASAPAFETERRGCNTLLAYFSPLVVPSMDDSASMSESIGGMSSTTSSSVPRERDNHPGAGWVPLQKKNKREEEFFIGSKKSSGKKSISSKGAAPSPSPRSNSGSKKLNIPLTIMTLLESNGIAPPTTFNDIPNTINEIQMKLQWFDEHETEATANNLAMMEASLPPLRLLAQ